jgi:hypothetical protein
MRFSSAKISLIGLALSSLAACSSGGDATTGSTSSGSGGGGGGSGGSGPLCTTPTPVACSDQVILQMNLQATPTKGAITSTPSGDGWESHIDATAGGFGAPMPDSYTYGKFTDTGLQKVDIADQDSLDSMDWDIAFRRYVVRVNSADSGPSCVQAARIPGDMKFEDVTAEPSGLSYHTDDYFTDSCDIIPDGSGLPDSPATALSSFWTYPGCVQMTHHVFAVELADGRRLKLTVDDYYSPAVQDQCDTTGMVPMSGSGSANFIMRWAFFK